jgi:hypothetical protein
VHTESTPNELMRMLSQRSNLDKFLHGHPNACWANTISSLAKHTRKGFNRLLSKRMNWLHRLVSQRINFSEKEGWTAWWSIHLIYGGEHSSTEGRLKYEGGDSWWWNKSVERCLLIYIQSLYEGKWEGVGPWKSRVFWVLCACVHKITYAPIFLSPCT